MTLFRSIPLWAHATVEILAGPAVMVAPFLFGFGQAATAICLLVGVLLIALALQVPGPARTLPLSSHASFDYALATFAVTAGVALGAIAGAWEATVFLVGIGAAQVVLTASTRFSLTRGAV